MRKIPKKNYFITFIIVVLTVIITFVLMNMYSKDKKYKISTNDNLTNLSEIKENELSNYLTENQEIILYMSSSNNIEYQEFEKGLNDLVKENNLSKKITYLNTYNVSENFYSEFNLKYLDNQNILFDKKSPYIFVIKDGKVINYLLSENIDIKSVNDFFNDNEVIE